VNKELTMEHWTDFGVGQLPSMSARKRAELPPPIEALVAERAGAVQRPLQGLTSDGTLRPGLFCLRSTGVSTAPIIDAASHFLGALSTEQRQRAVFPLDAEERRMWLNIHPFVFRHGVMLEGLIGTLIVSLVFEPLALAIRIAVGMHLAHRRDRDRL
jgi:hypothetical protein